MLACRSQHLQRLGWRREKMQCLVHSGHGKPVQHVPSKQLAGICVPAARGQSPAHPSLWRSLPAEGLGCHIPLTWGFLVKPEHLFLQPDKSITLKNAALHWEDMSSWCPVFFPMSWWGGPHPPLRESQTPSDIS